MGPEYGTGTGCLPSHPLSAGAIPIIFRQRLPGSHKDTEESNMNGLYNEHGAVCVSLDVFQIDGETWVISASWKNGAAFIDSRVITTSEGVDEELAAARALFERLGRPPFREMEEWRLKR
jgi:hypothetical protein